MKKVLINTLLLLAAIAASAQGLTPEDIKADDSYIWGEGYADTDEAASNKALSDLMSRISVQVASNFSLNESEINTSSGIDSKSAIESVVQTYSSGTLTNTGKIDIEHAPNAHVMRYIKRSELEKVFKLREDRIFSYMRSAEKAEKDGRIDDALRNYYWGFTLLKSLQHPNEAKYESMAEPGVQQLLMVWIPEQINSILGKLRTQIAEIDEETVDLYITYNDKPVTSADFRFMDGQNYSNICSAKDGMAQIEMRPGTPTDRIQIKFEYEFDGQTKQDKELEMVAKVFKGTPFPKSASTISAGKKKEMKAAKVEFQAALAATGTASHATVVEKPTEYQDIVSEVVKAIEKKNYESVQQRFTPEGYAMFDKLIHYGNAKLLGAPQLNCYELAGRVICRSVPMKFSFKNNKRQFTEDVTFTFNADKKIESIAFGLDKAARESIFNRESPWSNDVRMTIATFLENYKTAFALERLDYIRSIFSDDAIIITGTVTKVAKKTGENQKYLDNEIVRYNKYSKTEYLEKLAKTFDSNEFINIRFSDNDFRKSMAEGAGETFGIQIHQDYYSSNYSDTGYLFLVVDLNDAFQPTITVRTWQPDRDPSVNGGLGRTNPYYGLYNLGNF